MEGVLHLYFVIVFFFLSTWPLKNLQLEIHWCILHTSPILDHEQQCKLCIYQLRILVVLSVCFSPPNRMRWYGSWTATSSSAWKTRTGTTWCRSASSVCSRSPCSSSLTPLRGRCVLPQDTDSFFVFLYVALNSMRMAITCSAILHFSKHQLKGLHSNVRETEALWLCLLSFLCGYFTVEHPCKNLCP